MLSHSAAKLRDRLIEAKKLSEEGASFSQIASVLGVSRNTVVTWKRQGWVSPRVIKTQRREQVIASSVLLSDSWSELARRVGVIYLGRPGKQLKSDVKAMGLSTSHFSSKSKPSFRNCIPLEEILVENSTYSSTSSLKRRLFKEGLLNEHCDICGVSEWMNRPISLQLHHLNGNPVDHRIENLQILCPNCHSQTDNFAGRKQKRVKKPIERKIKESSVLKPSKPPRIPVLHRCLDCPRQVSARAFRCKSCAKINQNTKIKWPSDALLLERWGQEPATLIAASLGVSDNAVRKRVQRITRNLEREPSISE